MPSYLGSRELAHLAVGCVRSWYAATRACSHATHHGGARFRFPGVPVIGVTGEPCEAWRNPHIRGTVMSRARNSDVAV